MTMQDSLAKLQATEVIAIAALGELIQEPYKYVIDSLERLNELLYGSTTSAEAKRNVTEETMLKMLDNAAKTKIAITVPEWYTTGGETKTLTSEQRDKLADLKSKGRSATKLD